MNQNNRNSGISFTLIDEKEHVTIRCYEGEYRNLMVLINEKIYVEDFGECKGIGRCGTCLVEILSETDLPQKDRNEVRTLEKCAVKNARIRLSCQVMIDRHLQDAVVRVLEERQDVR